MEARAKSILDRPFGALTREFDLRAPVVELSLPVALFAEFVHLYHAAGRLERNLTAVLGDGEHQLFLEEGRKLGFKMPDVGLILDDLEGLRKALDAADPFGDKRRDDHQVSLTSRQAQGLLSLVSKTYDVVHDVFESLRENDYMKCLRHFRDTRHAPYAGDTALNDVVGAYFSVCRIHKLYSKFTKAVHEEQDRVLERKVEHALAEARHPPILVRDGFVHLAIRDLRP